MQPEELAQLQETLNTLQAQWNMVLDAAGLVRQRALTIGFAPEAADQIGVIAFKNVIGQDVKT